jgi:predicted ArsR family transcriptional regulator
VDRPANREEAPVRGDLDARLERVAALGEPVRRALYRFVVAQPEPVTREQAAIGVDVPHHVAKFHLDRLVADHLLEADYQRPPGRGGPGAGRPAKVYRRAGQDLAVSLPERRYDVAGHVLVRAVAVAERDHVPVGDALERVATEAGEAVGAGAREQLAGRPRRADLTNALVDVLVDRGYQPRAGRTGITLTNCPFHALVQDETDLVCGMNRDFIAGVLDGLGAEALDAQLDPAPGRCCVRICKS